MAFTPDELDSIREYLGHPSVWLFQSPSLEGVMATVGQDPAASARIRTILANLAEVDAQLTGQALVSAGVRSLSSGEVELYEGALQRELRKSGRMWVSRLSSRLGEKVHTDVYGEEGYSGHGWSRGQRSSLAGMG